MVIMGAKERFQKLLKKTFKKVKIKEKIRKNFNVTTTPFKVFLRMKF